MNKNTTPIKIVCITGCLGFMASYFVRTCLERGYYVIGIDKIDIVSNVSLLPELEKNNKFKFIQKDINNLTELYDCDYIVNFAASSHVDRSFNSGKQFLYDNVNGVYNLLELIRNKSKEIQPILIHISCYDEQTRTLTKNGLKTYDQLQIGDEVISINPNNKKIEFKKILKIIVQDYNGKMIHFKHKSDDLMTTPNHRMYLSNINKNTIEIETAASICDKSGLYYLAGKKDGLTMDMYHVDGIGNVPIKDLFYTSGVFIGDGFNAYQKQKRKNKSGLNKKDFLNICRYPLNGRLISIGKIGMKEYTECNCHRIFFDVPQNDKARKKLETSLTKLGIRWSSQKGKSGEHIYFSSKEWSTYFEQFGKYAKNKTIPNWMFDYDHSILYELYDGLIGSDGSWTQNKNGTKTGRLHITSYDLVQKSCILGSCLGFHMRYTTDKPRKNNSFINGREIFQKNKAYQVFFNNQKIGCGNKKYKEIEYKGKIWCLTVEDNKNFMVERNGLLKISGNTDETYGDIEIGSHSETDLLKPSNPYSSSKACGDMLILAWARTYGLKYNIIRPTNNYGIYQYPEKLIPKVCKSMMLGRKIPLHNNGTPRRMWLHAQDTTDGILTIIDKGQLNEIYNISGDCELKNIDVVSKIVKIMFNDNDIKKYCDFSYDRPGQDKRYSLNDDKLRSLGWKPVKEFDKELPTVVKYYKDNFTW